LDGSQETPLAPVSAERVDEGAPQPALAPAAPPEEAAPPTAESAPPADDPVLNTQALDPWLVGLGVFVVIMIIGFLALVIVGPRS